jgi:hypothetical protein
MNDSMATNGCCSGAGWGYAAPKFYRVEREVHELYYLPDDGTLYFLARVDAKASETTFKKIIDAVSEGKTVEDLAKAGLVGLPAKFVRSNPRGR